MYQIETTYDPCGRNCYSLAHIRKYGCGNQQLTMRKVDKYLALQDFKVNSADFASSVHIIHPNRNRADPHNIIEKITWLIK